MTYRQILYLAILTFLTLFSLMVGWEFLLENPFESLIGNFGQETKEAKWKDIFLTMGFTGTALIIPTLLLLKIATEYKRDQAALRENEGLLRNLLDHTPAIIAIRDTKGRFKLINRAYEQMFDVTDAEVKGKTIDDIMPESFAESLTGYDRTVIETGKRMIHEHPAILKHGGDTLLSVRFPINDSSGAVIAVGSIATDITELRKTEKALRESEQLLSAIIDAVPAIISVKDLDSRYLLFNHYHREFFGLEPGERMGKTSHVISQEHGERMRKLERQVIETGETVLYYNYKLVNTAGQERHVMVTKAPLRDIDDRISGVITVAIDMTDRVQAEDALRESEQRLRAIIDAVPAIIDVKDLDFRYELSNRYHREFNNFDDKEWRGQSSDMISKEHGERMRAMERQVIETGETVPYDEYKIVDGSGVDRALMITKAPLKNTADQIVGVISSAIDITDRSRAEEEVRRQRNEIAHISRLNTISEMVTILAHELNQPLTVIRGRTQASLDTLRAGTCESDQLVRQLEHVSSEAKRADQIIRRIRAFVRKENSVEAIVDINDLARDAADLFRDTAGSKGKIEIQLDLVDSLLTIMIDPIQIQQVIFNLLRNGMEATEGVRSGPRRLTIQTVEGGDSTVEVMIHDKGEGIPSDDLERIFDPFFSTKTGGLGLGLSISRSIVEAHGGRLWATSDAKAGSTFHLTLPVNPEHHSDDL